MDFNLLCTIFLACSASVLIFSIVLGFGVYKKRRHEADKTVKRRRFILTPFQIFLIGFFLSALLLFFPINYSDVFAHETGIKRTIDALFLSIHNGFQVFLLEGDYLSLQAVVCDITRVGETLGSIYSAYALGFFVVAPLLTAGFVLSFFKNISANVRYLLKRTKEVYYLSELNEKSLALAVNILKERVKYNPTILFFDVGEGEGEDADVLEQAKSLGAICFKKDITEISYKAYKKNMTRKLYFISNDKDHNVKQALSLIEYFRENDRLNTKNNEFYVFATSASSETLLDTADNGKLRVRRINENKNLALKTLMDYPIFDRYLPEAKKKLSVMIVGLGQYGWEVLKGLCWSGQMYGYELTVHVVDGREDVLDYAKTRAPELIEYNGKRIEGEPYYDIRFYGGVDVTGVKFRELIDEIGQVTTIYMTLGDDELNLETAISTSMEYQRANILKGWQIPQIFTVVYSTVKNQTISANDGIKSIDGKKYPITLIGDRMERYSLETIELPTLEKEAIACHLQWSKTEEERAIAQAKFEKYEYYRRASTAEAVHKKLRKGCGVVESNGFSQSQIMALEHLRWNAYMRAEGFVHIEGQKDFLAKAHYDLVPTKGLAPDEYLKDWIIAKESKDGE